MKRIKIKNLMILGSFFSLFLIAIILYILNSRLTDVEGQEKTFEINFIIDGKKDESKR